MANEERQKQLAELLKQAESGIKEVFNSDRYMDYLKTMSKFHNYSIRNILLIEAQRPDATRVAGYVAWRDKFQRQVQKGEKGIAILGYTPKRIYEEVFKRDPDTDKILLKRDGTPQTERISRQIPSYTPVYVYDISQTDGEPLPKLVSELQGDVTGYNDLMTALKEVSPFPIEFEAMAGEKKGYCSYVDRRIAIKEGMSEAQTVKTAVHEITHMDLHSPESNLNISQIIDRSTKEVEAESVAYVVCSHYGLDTSDYSFGYLASWSSDKELKELTSSLDKIQKQAGDLIDRIDSRLAELQKEQTISIPEKETSAPVPQGEKKLTIYQLAEGYQNRNRRFISFDALSARGERPEMKNYNPVYECSMPYDATLNSVYNQFNINMPSDFMGHSLSMSDMVVIEYLGEAKASYVDFAGYQDCPDFATEHMRLAEVFHDAVKYDTDIDMDKENSKERAGYSREVIHGKTEQLEVAPPKKLSMKERMEAAKLEAGKRNSEMPNDKAPRKEREVL
jgi:hypothetical protein